MPFASNDEGLAPVELRLVFLKAEDDIQTFHLYDGVCVKLGRQVKSAQEKLLAAGGTLPHHIDILPESEPCAPTTYPTSDGEGAQNQVDGGDSEDALNNMTSSQTVCTPKFKKSSGAEHAWYKSKVVSRSHAEIWLRDGQVSQFTLAT